MSKRLSLEEIKSKKYGRLTVLREVESGKKGVRKFECLCQCNSKTIVLMNHLRNSHTKSYGCLQNESRIIHNLCKRNNMHPIYRVWTNMISRCYGDYKYRSEYQRYKKRGIRVCNEWKNNFGLFAEWALNNGWEKGLEIDRIDNDGNYEPSNCRFTTHKENNRNKGDMKLTTKDVDEIRSLYKIGKYTYIVLAEKYKVSKERVGAIVRNKKWV
ncbi:MAG: hypothetical protein ACFE95_02765 [Candidatus Hodarchaeota archaeon]